MSDRTYLTFLAHHVPNNKISVFAEIFGPCLVNENPDDWDPVEIRPLSRAGAPKPEPVEDSRLPTPSTAVSPSSTSKKPPAAP